MFDSLKVTTREEILLACYDPRGCVVNDPEICRSMVKDGLLEDAGDGVELWVITPAGYDAAKALRDS